MSKTQVSHKNSFPSASRMQVVPGLPMDPSLSHISLLLTHTLLTLSHSHTSHSFSFTHFSLFLTHTLLTFYRKVLLKSSLEVRESHSLPRSIYFLSYISHSFTLPEHHSSQPLQISLPVFSSLSHYPSNNMSVSLSIASPVLLLGYQFPRNKMSRFKLSS